MSWKEILYIWMFYFVPIYECFDNDGIIKTIVPFGREIIIALGYSKKYGIITIMVILFKCYLVSKLEVKTN